MTEDLHVVSVKLSRAQLARIEVTRAKSMAEDPTRVITRSDIIRRGVEMVTAASDYSLGIAVSLNTEESVSVPDILIVEEGAA